jgi:hypothetical protein
MKTCASHKVAQLWQCVVSTETVVAMKLSIAVLLVNCFPARATDDSQHVTIDLKNATLEQMLKEVGRQTGYKYVILGDIKPAGYAVTISQTDADLQRVLKAGFEQLPLGYYTHSNIIFVHLLDRNDGDASVNAPPSKKTAISIIELIIVIAGLLGTGWVGVKKILKRRKEMQAASAGETKIIYKDKDKTISILTGDDNNKKQPENNTDQLNE